MSRDDKEPVEKPPCPPKPDDECATDETADLRRELTDDEIVWIAGGMVGTNETHTKGPTSA
jgi:hypothetical protein